LKELSGKPDVGHISEMVDSVIRSDAKLARQFKLYFCHRYSGKKLKEIGKFFNLGESGVSQTSRRVSPFVVIYHSVTFA
jgi:putative transposase